MPVPSAAGWAGSHLQEKGYVNRSVPILVANPIEENLTSHQINDGTLWFLGKLWVAVPKENVQRDTQKSK